MYKSVVNERLGRRVRSSQLVLSVGVGIDEVFFFGFEEFAPVAPAVTTGQT